MKRASDGDIRKLTELIKNTISSLSKIAFSGKYSDLAERATAKDVGALPIEGGVLKGEGRNVLGVDNLHPEQADTLIRFFLRGVSKGEITVADSGRIYYRDNVHGKILLSIGEADRRVYADGDLKKILVEGEALLTNNGAVEIESIEDLKIKRTNELDSAIQYLNSKGILGSIGVDENGIPSFWGSGVKRKILVDEVPEVKETRVIAKDGGLKVFGKKGSVNTDITDIFVKANTAYATEGIIFGICSNRMGYIISQNFRIDCTKLTDSERQTVQSFDSIVLHRDNDSSNYPTLMPANQNFIIMADLTSKTGYSYEPVKITISSNSARTQVTYRLPSKFRTDDYSQRNLSFYTDEWVTMFGINVKG